MKKTHIYIKIALFLSVLILPTVCWGVISLFGMKDKFDFDLEEKREKHTISSDVKLSELPGEVEKYYNDRVPFRSLLIKANNKFNTAIEKKYMEKIEPVFLGWINSNNNNNNVPDDTPVYVEEETFADEQVTEDNIHKHNFVLIDNKPSDYENYGYEIYKCQDCKEEKKYTLEKLIDTSLYPMKTIGNTTIIGRYNWLFYENTLSDYQGDNIIPDDGYEAHVNPLIKLKKLCDEIGKEIYFIILPNKNSVYAEYMPTMSRVAEKHRVELLKEYIDNNVDIPFVYPLKEMIDKKYINQLYYKYDTHWSPYGFQVGVNALYNLMKMEQIKYEEYEILPVEKHTGDLAILAGMDISSYPSDVEGVISYKTNVNCNEINLDMNRFIETYSDSPNKKKIVFMGDSFRLGFKEFLSKDFSYMYMFDREAKGNTDVEKSIKEADVIVIELVERKEILLPEDANYIYNVLNQ